MQETYELVNHESLKSDFSLTDVVLLDRSALPNGDLDSLAQTSVPFGSSPVILLLDQVPTSKKEYRTIRSLTADFLVQDQLSASGLNNTIQYVLETNRLKKQLDLQQKRYSSLFYNSVEPAFFLDEEFTITSVNSAFLNVFNVSKRRALDKPFLEFIQNVKDRSEIRDDIVNLSKGSLDKKVRFASKEGGVRFLGHLKVSPLRESVFDMGMATAKIQSYHGTLRNISHQNRLKTIQQQNEKIATTYKLARAMAHEIRNPLTNVNLAIDQLKEETKNHEHLDMYYDIVQRCTGRIDGLLGQLLSSSEQEFLERDQFDGVSLVKDVVSEILDRARLEGVELDASYEATIANLEGDKKKIKIAFTNLFTNAIESMDKPEKKIRSTVSLDGDYLCLTVSDNGVGMEKAQLDSLFDPFYTSKPNGVGLGLTSTQTIVSEHNGEIEVESEKGVGSKFSVFLPLYRL